LEEVTKSGNRVILLQNSPELEAVGASSILTKLLNRGKIIQPLLVLQSVNNEDVFIEKSITRDFPALQLLNSADIPCP
jgi:hypothetical protein